MKRLLVLAGLIGLLFTSSLRAQESLESQLEYVRKLRDKGYLDLAKEYLDKLRAIPDAALQALLPLESARISIATARMREPDQRPALFLAARVDLQAYVDKNPGRPEAAQARLEIARLAAFQGETLLTKALREDDPKSKTEQARKAEAQFILAGQELEVAAKQLAEFAATYKNPDADVEKTTRAQLLLDAYQARFDRAANLINRARTYLDDGKTDTRRQRGELMKEAIKSLEAVLEGDTPMAIKRMAEAWLIKSNQEIQDAQVARKYFNRVMADETPAAQPAHRLARMFDIQGMVMHIKGELVYNDLKDTPRPKLLLKIQSDALAWLKTYPSHTKTNEGMAVQFELGNVYYHLGDLAMGKDPKDKNKRVMTPAATKLFNQALKYFSIVADSDSEYAESATGASLKLSVDRIKDLELFQIKNFDDAFLKAKYEFMLVRQADLETAKDPSPQNGKKLKSHLRTLIAALQRTQNLADAKTSPIKLDEVRYYLMTAFWISRDAYRAAVAGDYLGRTKPVGKRSPLGASYAIEAYAAIYNKDKDEGNRLRLQSLTDFVLGPESQKVWSSDPVTSVARYQLAMLHQRDDDWTKALENLEKLPRDFSGYHYATGQAVFIALEGRQKAKDPQEKSFYEQEARKALGRMPALPNDVDASTAAMFFSAQLEQPKFLYADAALELKKNELLKAAQKYMDMLKFLDQNAAQLAKLKDKLTAATWGRLDFTIDVLRKFAKLGQADIEYRTGKYDKVLEITAEVVKATEAKAGTGADPIRLKDVDVTSQMLGLALRANVQKGQKDSIIQAKKILNWLDRLKGAEGEDFDATNTLLALIIELRVQVDELKKAKDEQRLKVTIANFSGFADELASKPKLETRDYIFLASFYNSLGEYPKAANLYSKVPQPTALDVKKPDEAQDKEIANYWYLQIEYAKALRMGKQDKKDPNLKTANKVLETLLRHPNARFTLNAQVEQNLLLMDLELYGTAIKKWGEFMNNPGIKKILPDDPRIKRLYFEAYYHNAVCWYEYSQTEAVIKAGKEKQNLTAAGRYIVRLESATNPEGWQLVGDMFRRLLEEKPKLKEEYESQKNNLKKALK